MSQPYFRIQLTAFVTVIGSILFGGPSVDAKSRTDVSRIGGEVAQLTARLEKLNKELSRKKALLEDGISLQKRIAQSSRTLETLKAQQTLRQQVHQELQHWATASLVLGNQNTPSILAIKETGTVHRVIARASHPFQQYALEVAIQAAVPNRADADVGQIIGAIEDAAGRSGLPLDLSDEISSQIRNVSNQVLKKVNQTRYMVFRDAATDTQRVAIVLSNQEPYKFLTIDHETGNLAQSAFVAGSAWIGGPSEVEHHLELGTPFIDYCVLGITHALSQQRSKHIALAMKATLDRSLQNYVFTAQGRFLNTATKGYTINLSTESTDVSGREMLEAFARQIEDEFSERIVRHGIRLLEREHQEAVTEEEFRLDHRPLSSHTSKASHSLLVELDRATNGKERISVRLVDLTNGESIWAANDSAAIFPNRNWKNYQLHSGDPTLAIFKTPETQEAYFAHLKETEGEAFASVTDKVILVNEGTNDQEVLLRSLFGKQVKRLSTKEVDFVRIPSLPDTNLDHILPSKLRKQVLQYIVHRFSQRLAPPAIRVKWGGQDESPKTWTISLGAADNIAPGDRFRMLFPSKAGDALSAQPFLASVTEVIDAHSCRISLPGTVTVRLDEDAECVAVCDSWKNSQVAIMQPQVLMTDSQRRSEKRYFYAKTTGYEFGRILQLALMQGLSIRVESTLGQWERLSKRTSVPWDEDIDEAKTTALLGSRGVTHVICGDIRNIREKEFEVRIGLQELTMSSENKWSFGKVIDSVRVTLNRTNF